VQSSKIADGAQLALCGGVKSALKKVIEGALDADVDTDVRNRLKGQDRVKVCQGGVWTVWR